MAKENNTITYLALLAFIISGFSLMAGQIYSLYKSYESEEWPRAKGTVVSTEMYAHDATNRANLTYYNADIWYQFFVAEKRYSNNQITMFDYVNHTSPDEPEQLLKKFPKGSTVSVYYDPTNPNNAVLIPGGYGFSYLYFIVGMILFSFGASLLYLQVRTNH